MDIAGVIVTAIASAIAAGVSAYFTYRGVKARAEADAEVDAKKWAVERQRILAEAGSVDIAAIRGIAEAARDYAIELQSRVDELEAALEAERKLRRKLEHKFDMFIALVRKAAPELDLDSILAKLETGPL